MVTHTPASGARLRRCTRILISLLFLTAAHDLRAQCPPPPTVDP